MTPRALAALLGAWLALVVAVGVAVAARFSLSRVPAAEQTTIASVWAKGERIARQVLAPGAPGDGEGALRDVAAKHGGTLVHETVVAEGPLPGADEVLLTVSLVAGLDGVHVTLGDKSAWITPDDLLARSAYDHGTAFEGLGLTVGTDAPKVLAMACDALGASIDDVRHRATFRRFRAVRTVPGAPPPPKPIGPDDVTREAVAHAAREAARYLARGVDDAGHFRYLVEATSNRTLVGYNWPRHAGATYFLAQVAGRTRDPELVPAALRAAGILRDHLLVDCGEYRCIADTERADLGSSALGLLALTEVVEGKLDPADGFRRAVADLARFLRAMQRDDGEFMHEYDRPARAPVDVQYMYYSGEATLALGRAHRLTGAAADLDAARRGLRRLVGSAWSFFGDRYYFAEEHWTCQAMGDLWDRAPDPAALDFCERWLAYNGALQLDPGEGPFDGDGAVSFPSLVTPRTTPTASRCEAGVATIRAARAAHRPDAELRPLERHLRRALAFLLRSQFDPGPAHLFADPAAVAGAFPGSSVDWALRIDYAQHAGSALVRWNDP